MQFVMMISTQNTQAHGQSLNLHRSWVYAALNHTMYRIFQFLFDILLRYCGRVYLHRILNSENYAVNSLIYEIA